MGKELNKHIKRNIQMVDTLTDNPNHLALENYNLCEQLVTITDQNPKVTIAIAGEAVEQQEFSLFAGKNAK